MPEPKDFASTLKHVSNVDERTISKQVEAKNDSEKVILDFRSKTSRPLAYKQAQQVALERNRIISSKMSNVLTTPQKAMLKSPR